MPYGIEHSSRTPHSEMSASSSAHGIHPYNGRLNNGNYWAPASTDDDGWLQIVKNTAWTIHQVATQVGIADMCLQYTL